MIIYFRLYKKIEFYKNDRYRDYICKLLFELIMCYDPMIREKIKDVLNLVFTNILKNEKQNKDKDEE